MIPYKDLDCTEVCKEGDLVAALVIDDLTKFVQPVVSNRPLWTNHGIVFICDDYLITDQTKEKK